MHLTNTKYILESVRISANLLNAARMLRRLARYLADHRISEF